MKSAPLGPAPSSPLKAHFCFKCLGHCHLRKDCRGLVRCKSCFNYGHVSSSCLYEARNQRQYRPISHLEGKGSHATTPIYPSPSPALGASVHTVPPSPTVRNPKYSTAMVNWAVDPVPHIPKGSEIEAPVPHPPLRHEVFMTGCYTLEDLAIVKLEPASPPG